MLNDIFSDKKINDGFYHLPDVVGRIKLSNKEYTQEQKNDLYYLAKQQCSIAGEVFDSDPELSLNMIVDAINSLPEVAPLFFYKLSYYLRKLNLYEQAYYVIEIVQAANDFDNISMYNMYKSIDIEKYSLILYSEKEYQLYIYYFFRWYHNRILAFAFQGRKDALVEMIKIEDKLSLWAPTRINNCFKALGLKYLVPKYNSEIHNYTDEIRETLLRTCKEIQKLYQKSSLNSGLSVGDYINSLVRKNSGVFETYKVLNNSYDDVFYHKNIESIFS